ncbi:MAG: hypothetical protein KJN89_09870 [Gammaproteobacteria bacterium]|nr:hypothetical protein [Gammaproteobacteria bacterium]NNJ50671.1 hypothetical protein [Gammaproteobacteria bacterium]
MLNMLHVLAVVTSMQAMLPITVKTPELEISFMPRTPDQLGSFYEARGFPKEMRDILSKQCFITVGITNTSKEKIWHDLSNWQFSTAGKPIKRQHRDYWKKRWQDMGVPLSKQSTFRWTLIPEALDYLPDEHEGGNIILPVTDQPITLNAIFATGDNKQGKKITIHTDKLFCAEDPQ